MQMKFALALAAVGASLAFGSQAQTPAAATGAAPASASVPPWGPGMGRGPMMGGRRGGPRHAPLTAEQRKALFAERMQHEAEALKITPAQKSHWMAYVHARERMQQDRPMMSPEDRDARFKQMQAMTPDQRLEFHAAQMREHAKQMDSVAAASRKLRAALSPEQRKTFDAMYARHDGARGPQGRGEWRGRGMPPVPPASAGMMPPPAAQ